MLISLEWLQDYVDTSAYSVTELADTLTMLGLEVEGVQELPPIAARVVVGKVLSAVQHPNSDRLTLCVVDSGEGEREIICGAHNVKAGMKVAVAQPGAIIEGREIGTAKIRGTVSHGMICSERELGLGDEHDGILPLDDTLVIGTCLDSIYPTQDSVLDLSITPNRGDCLSYLGIARELAAKLQLPLKPPVCEAVSFATATERVQVEIETDSGCYRFCTLHASITASPPAPYYMRRRLRANGVRPLNAIVDITNYVMLEYGQPLHAYDATTISGNTIKVRQAQQEATFTALDAKPRQLQRGDILICDAERVIGLAGIIGGENSEIKPDTRELVVEIASFDARSVRKTSKRLALHTESAHRFERHVDIELLPQIAMRTRYLLSQSLPAGVLQTLSEQPGDVYPAPQQPRKVALRLPRTRKMLGLPALTQNNCQQYLERLAFKLLDHTDERLLWEVPSFRHDVSREIDLIEEVGRLHGLDQITSALPLVQQSLGVDDTLVIFQNRLKVACAALGLQETVNFAMTAPRDYGKLMLADTHPLYPSLHLRNPINDQLQALQTTLLPNLLHNISNNRKHRNKGTRLFEMGRGYFRADLQVDAQHEHYRYLQQQGLHVSNDNTAMRPRELNIVAAIIDTPYQFASWRNQEVQPDIYLGKKLLLQLLRGFGLSEKHLTIAAVHSRDVPFFNPFAALYVYSKDLYLGCLGELHPQVLSAFKLDGKVLFFELLSDNIYRLAQQRRKIGDYSNKYPPVQRDLAFVLAQDIPYREVAAALQNFPDKKHLADFRLFDIFTDAALGAEKKSMAFSLSFASLDKTLTDAEVDQEIAALLNWMQEKLNARLR